jgi:hypothetical protein
MSMKIGASAGPATAITSRPVSPWLTRAQCARHGPPARAPIWLRRRTPARFRQLDLSFRAVKQFRAELSSSWRIC